MNSPAILTIFYAVAIAAFQAALLHVLPPTGMGSIGLTYIVWPLLAVSTVALFYLLCRIGTYRWWCLLASIALMAVLSVWLHPQDSQTSFDQKMNALARWAMSGLRSAPPSRRCSDSCETAPAKQR